MGIRVVAIRKKGRLRFAPALETCTGRVEEGIGGLHNARRYPIFIGALQLIVVSKLVNLSKRQGGKVNRERVLVVCKRHHVEAKQRIYREISVKQVKSGDGNIGRCLGGLQIVQD